MAQVYNSQLVRSSPFIPMNMSLTLPFEDAFDLYHKIQETPEKTTSILGGPALPALGHAIAGSTGAAISNICTYPLALIITRLQIQRQLRKNTKSPHHDEYRSISDAVQKIYTHEGGLNGFYVGILADTSKTIADSFLFFLAYNFLRQSRIRASKSSHKHLPVLDELSVGFLAGAFSKFLTTPISNIVTRKQTASMLSAREPSKDTDQGSVRSLALQIHSEKGIKGFWSGYSASLVLTLNPSLTFFFFETMKRTLISRDRRSNPSAQVTFLIAAISKALAASITYPFSLAKSRLQASADNEHDDSDVKLSPARTSSKPSRNVFSTVISIAQAEGIIALYEGLSGEVLKGFFSYGITMIVKEAVHKLVIQLYYVVLKLLKRYPSPHELAAQAKEQAEMATVGLGQKAQQAAASAKDGLQVATKSLAEEARKDLGGSTGD